MREETKTTKNDFKMNFRFRKKKASSKIGKFKEKILYPAGSPITISRIEAIPETPPGAIFAGMVKMCKDKAKKKAPTTNPSSENVFFA